MLKKILLIVSAVMVLGLMSFYFYVQSSWNKTYDWPAPNLQISQDSAVIAHGAYLVNGPAHCNACHVSNFGDMVAGDKGATVALAGGIMFPLGPLGKIYTRNLTPDKKTGLGRYSDDKIFRMMRHGIRPTGESSMPILMPFWKMADDDMIAVVSYLRSLEPVEHVIPDNEWTFMGKVIRTLSSTFKPIVNPDAPATAPPIAPTVERGEYLANYVSNCVGCHTNRDMMTYQAIGPEFAGGMEFEPWVEFHKYLDADTTMWLRSPNITSDPGGVLAKYKTAEEFIARFRMGRAYPFSPMDWGAFSRMKDDDLAAIWMYLNSLPPVKNDVGAIAFTKDE